MHCKATCYYNPTSHSSCHHRACVNVKDIFVFFLFFIYFFLFDKKCDFLEVKWRRRPAVPRAAQPNPAQPCQVAAAAATAASCLPAPRKSSNPKFSRSSHSTGNFIVGHFIQLLHQHDLLHIFFYCYLPTQIP